MCKILQILLQVMLSLADSSLTPIILMKKDPFSDLNLKTSLGQLKWSGKKIYFPKMLKKQKKHGVCICSNIFFSIFDAGNI